MTLDYLRQSLFFFRTHLYRLAMIQLPFLLLLALVQHQLLSGAEAEDTRVTLNNLFISTALDLALMPIYWGATLLYMQSVLQNSPLTPGQAISRSLGCWGRLLLTYILTTLAVSTGLLIFILPGIYIGVRLAFAEFYCVMENKGAVDSIRASWNSSSDFFWPLLQGLALIFGLILLAEVLVGQLLEDKELPRLAFSLLIQFLGVLPSIYAYRLYCVMKEDSKPA